jgi:hypothetical protein
MINSARITEIRKELILRYGNIIAAVSVRENHSTSRSTPNVKFVLTVLEPEHNRSLNRDSPRHRSDGNGDCAASDSGLDRESCKQPNPPSSLHFHLVQSAITNNSFYQSMNRSKPLKISKL